MTADLRYYLGWAMMAVGVGLMSYSAPKLLAPLAAAPPPPPDPRPPQWDGGTVARPPGEPPARAHRFTTPTCDLQCVCGCVPGSYQAGEGGASGAGEADRGAVEL